MRPAMALRDEHLAVLHQRARELEVPRYRMLPRDELIEAIEERGGGADRAPDRAESTRAERAPKADDRADAAEKSESERETEAEPEAEAEEVTGVLDRMPQGYGFLRLAGLSEAEGDVYVSASQIRRCELRPGD